jgi:hypothetical protein
MIMLLSKAQERWLYMSQETSGQGSGRKLAKALSFGAEPRSAFYFLTGS